MEYTVQFWSKTILALRNNGYQRRLNERNFFTLEKRSSADKLLRPLKSLKAVNFRNLFTLNENTNTNVLKLFPKLFTTRICGLWRLHDLQNL